MGKADIRIVHVPRWLTVVAWLAVTAAMVVSVELLSGRAYVRPTPFANLLRTATTGTAMLAAFAPAMADILFFLPWGALAFLSLDREAQPRKVTYLVTIALGVAFALALLSWQNLLPTRISQGVDALWNVAGCAAGAVLGHARKRLRVRFE